MQSAQYQKSKQPNQRMDRRPKQTFIQRRHTNGQQTREKMLKIAHCWRNVIDFLSADLYLATFLKYFLDDHFLRISWNR